MDTTTPGQFNNATPISSTISPSVPSTLPFSTISGTTPINTPLPTNPAASLNSLVASTTQQVTNANIEDTKAKGDVNTTSNDLSSLIASLGGQTADQNAAETAQGLPQLNKDLLDLQNTARQQNIEYQTTPYSLAGQGRGITTGILRGQEAVKQRQVGIDLLVTNSNIAAKQGNIILAQNLADKAVVAKYDPIKQAIQAKQFILSQQSENLSRTDKKLADAQQNKLSLQLKQVENEQQNAKDINAIKLEAAKNGAPNVVLSAMDKATTIDEALTLSKGYLQDTLEKQIKQQQLLKLQNENKQSLGLSTGINSGKNAGIINTILGSGKFTNQQANAVTRAINNGEDAFTVVKNNAKNIMGQTEATKVIGYETAKQSLEDINTSLKEFYAMGGKTGIFSGNYENTINKLGSVSDPRFVSLATQIATALQVYRNAVTGTAYSVQEGQSIEKIFPGINKTQGLNDAILDGRAKAFDSVIDGAYRSTLGSAYDKLKESDGVILSKGKLSDKNFIEQALTNLGLKYTEVIKKIPGGKIGVVNNKTGEVGAIDEKEFNPALYTKL